MQQENNFIVLNIRDYFENNDKRLGEDKLLQLLSEFSCRMVAFVETENKAKLLSFYENYGFKQFDTRQTTSKESESHELVQLLRLI